MVSNFPDKIHDFGTQAQSLHGIRINLLISILHLSTRDLCPMYCMVSQIMQVHAFWLLVITSPNTIHIEKDFHVCTTNANLPGKFSLFPLKSLIFQPSSTCVQCGSIQMGG